MPKLIRKTLAEIMARPLSKVERAHLRALAKTEGLVPAPIKHVAKVWGKLDRENYSDLSLAGPLGKGRAPVSIKKIKAGTKAAMARAGRKGLSEPDRDGS